MLVAVVTTCAGEHNGVRSDSRSHSFHGSDSYVLVTKQQAIARGPDFSQRASALRYGKRMRVQNFVWFSTEGGCFVAQDSESLRKIALLEEKQKQLTKRWRRDASNPEKATLLRKEQAEHTQSRDEFVWKLFADLNEQGLLRVVNGDCTPR